LGAPGFCHSLFAGLGQAKELKQMAQSLFRKKTFISKGLVLSLLTARSKKTFKKNGF
jgi:hypothetical protein